LFRRLCKNYSNRKANEESADKVTDEVSAGSHETKKRQSKKLTSVTGTYQDKWFEMLL
jgi:hypothetical protein